MSTEPKRVELTEAERAALMHHIGGWKFERQGLARAEDAFMAEVSRIVAARMAEAWDDGHEAGEEYAESFHMPTTPCEEPNPYRATEEES